MENPDREAVTCAGHEELRDIVIETRTDVKYIREALTKGDQRMTDQDKRINALEAEQDKRKGFEDAVKQIATVRATIVSIVISGLIVLIGFIAYLWPRR